MTGKGDKRRPMQISQQELDDRWDAVFNAKPNENMFHEPRNTLLFILNNNKFLLYPFCKEYGVFFSPTFIQMANIFE